MHSLLHMHIADERNQSMRERVRVADVLAATDRAHDADEQRSPVSTLAVRFAHNDERNAIGRLAALDSRRAPHGDVLVALVDGEMIAAMSVADGRVVADPFTQSANAVSMLRMRGEQIRSAESASARRWAPRRRVRRAV